MFHNKGIFCCSREFQANVMHRLEKKRVSPHKQSDFHSEYLQNKDIRSFNPRANAIQMINRSCKNPDKKLLLSKGEISIDKANEKV